MFTPADFDTLTTCVIDAWTSGVDRDWSVRAGTLEWSCLQTADHTVDCVFSYAFFLASRKEDGYPNFGELHALPGATPADLIEGLRAACNMLTGVILSAPPDARAVIWRKPQPVTAPPQDFAARGAHELVLHGHDVCEGLGLPLRPPGAECARLIAHTSGWPGVQDYEPSGDPWSDLLVRSGRPRPGA